MGKTRRTWAQQEREAWTEGASLMWTQGDFGGVEGTLRMGGFLVSMLTSQWRHSEISRKKGRDRLQRGGRGTFRPDDFLGGTHS